MGNFWVLLSLFFFRMLQIGIEINTQAIKAIHLQTRTIEITTWHVKTMLMLSRNLLCRCIADALIGLISSSHGELILLAWDYVSHLLRSLAPLSSSGSRFFSEARRKLSSKMPPDSEDPTVWARLRRKGKKKRLRLSTPRTRNLGRSRHRVRLQFHVLKPVQSCG